MNNPATPPAPKGESPAATTQQKAAIGAICSRLGIDKEAKADLVNQFSYGRTNTSRELSMSEARAMIDHLQRAAPQPPKGEDPRDKMRGKIFYYAHELGWTKTNKQGRRVADGQRVDEWMLKYSYLKKKLNSYKFDELPKLVSQFEAYYKYTLNK